MTTPTGTIGLYDVNIELGRAGGAAINMNEAAVRSLAGVPSGAISMNDLRGKSSAFKATATGTYSGGGNQYWGFRASPLSPAMGSINVSTYKGYVIKSLYGGYLNDGWDWAVGLHLLGNTVSAIPSVTFQNQGWGTYTAYYISSWNWTSYVASGSTEDPYTENPIISGVELQWLPA